MFAAGDFVRLRNATTLYDEDEEAWSYEAGTEFRVDDVYDTIGVVDVDHEGDGVSFFSCDSELFELVGSIGQAELVTSNREMLLYPTDGSNSTTFAAGTTFFVLQKAEGYGTVDVMRPGGKRYNGCHEGDFTSLKVVQ